MAYIENNQTQIERNQILVKKVNNFFDERTQRQHFELNKLIELTSFGIQKFSDQNLKLTVQQALDEDIVKMTNLNAMASLGDPFPFRFNKLLDLLTQSKKYIDLNWNYIELGNMEKLLFSSNGISWEGTSMLNYMQTTMLEILSVIYETSIVNLKCLKEVENIYQIETSPNIQSICVTYTNSVEKFELLKDWRWSCKKDLNSYKLVTPSLGYAYGGSRFESEFAEKLFKLQDCSSFVGELLHLNLFTTNSLKIFTQSNFEKEVEMQQGEKNLVLLKKTLRYKGANSLPEAGNVFLVKSHCGFVIETTTRTKGNSVKEDVYFKTCEFTRFMPFFEGLVKMNCKLNDDGKWLKESFNGSIEHELLEYVGKTNENTTSLPIEPTQMFFFEVIECV